MNYPNTYHLMLSMVKWYRIESLDDFTDTQRTAILTEFQAEADKDLQHAMMHDEPFSKKLSRALINLSSLSKNELHITQKEVNDICWGNIRSFLDDILDEAQCQDFRESGGISDYEDARRLDISIRCREAANEQSSRGVA